MAEEEFWTLDPALIYSIFEHKIDIAKEIIKRKGNKMGKEPHAGARKRTKVAILAAQGDMESSSDEESSSDGTTIWPSFKIDLTAAVSPSLAAVWHPTGLYIFTPGSVGKEKVFISS